MRILSGMNEPIYNVQFSPDGRRLLVSTFRNHYTWDLPAEKGPQPTERHIRAAVFTPESDSLLAFHKNRDIRRIDLATRAFVGNPLTVDLRGIEYLSHLFFSPDHSRLVAIASLHRPPLFWWSWPELKPHEGWPEEAMDQFYPRDLSFAPNGQALAVLASGTVQWRDTQTGRLHWSASIPVHYREPRLACSPDGRYVATSNGPHLFVLNAANGAVLHQSRLERKHIGALAFTPDGRFLALVSNEATVKFFDTSSWCLHTELAWKVGGLRCLAFSPDGMLAGAAGSGKKVVLWDLDF
jgi:WD40 repeat protein